MKNLSLTILAFFLSFASFAIGPITGVMHVCTGSTTVVTDITPGGVWSSSDVAIATIGVSGIVTGVSPGTTIITYAAGGFDTTATITVYPNPAPITGATTVCVGSSAALSDASAGGIWTSVYSSYIAVGSTSGIITGISAGSVPIDYTLPTGCFTSETVTATGPSPVSGPTTVCVGGTIILTDPMSGGVWTTSGADITVGAGTGVVTGVSVGTATVSYAVGGCSVAFVVTVSSTLPPITGSTTICSSMPSTLSDATGGGTWSSSNVLVATVGLSSGLVAGLAPGTATIIYTNTCGTVSTVVTIYASPAVISGPSSICVGGTGTYTDATSGGTWSASLTGGTLDPITGILTGVSAGGGIISYTTTSGCFSATTVSISSGASAISGPSTVCPGGTITLSDVPAGGTWSSSTSAVATVGMVTGVVIGAAMGTTTITYTIGTGCSAYTTISVSSGISAITGTTAICTGGTTTLSDITGGGTWSSTATTVAAINPTTGVVSALSAGSTTINYITSCGTVSTVVTVNPSPAPITGATSVCAGATETLTDATTGGTWSGSTSGITVGALTGLVSGITAGSGTMIVYTIPTGCTSTMTVSVTGTTAIGAISGSSSVCVGSSITLTDATPGGVWSSSSTSIATVGGTGLVTGISAGSVDISYSVTETCGTVTVTHAVTVGASGSAGTITGSSTVTVGSATALSDAVAGGYWSSANPSIADIGSGSGVVTGISAGTAMISYTVPGCSGSISATYVITVTPADLISGNVVFSGTPYYGSVTVWLITYNPSTYMLEAIDSTTVSASGSSVAYSFTGEPTDSFRIKAAVATFTGTGYIPTYHTSSYYWNSANVLYHVHGTSDVSQNIDMATGTSTGGPGFVGGNVMTGANRGTSGTAPAIGLLMYAFNTTTGTILQQAYTDASGNYSFSNLPVGNYTIYPEALNYNATPYLATISGTADSVTAVNFVEHTVSRTITPGSTGIANVNPTASSVVIFPNPTTGNLNVQWIETANETGNVTIADITGREIYKTIINMTAGAGISQLDLSALTSGLYIISVKSGDINYNNKIQVQH